MRSTTTKSSAVVAASRITAEEIHQRILDKEYSNRHKNGTIICSRCERDIGRIEAFYMNTHLHRGITLKLPPEQNRVKPKEFYFHMCHWCVTEFLKFMTEKKEEGEREKRK